MTASSSSNPSGLQRLNSMGSSCLAYSGADCSPLFITRASGGIVIEIFILIISASQKSKQDQEQPWPRDAADRRTRGRWVTKERRGQETSCAQWTRAQGVILLPAQMHNSAFQRGRDDRVHIYPERRSSADLPPPYCLSNPHWISSVLHWPNNHFSLLKPAVNRWWCYGCRR